MDLSLRLLTQACAALLVLSACAKRQALYYHWYHWVSFIAVGQDRPLQGLTPQAQARLLEATGIDSSENP